MSKDIIIQSDLTESQQYDLVCYELKNGCHDKVLPICFQMGHNHHISANSQLAKQPKCREIKQ